MAILNLYNGKAQREHIDEGVERLMAKNGWQQTFKLEFARLGLGFAAVAVALYVYYLERTVPFRESRNVLAVLCALYFSFYLGSWAWKKYIEKDAMFIGTKNGAQVWITTQNPKNTNEYEVVILVRQADQKVREIKHTFLINEVVDTTGVVHEEVLTKIIELVDAKK